MTENLFPYKLPKNWHWTKVGHLVTLHRGVSYKKNDAHKIKENGDCLIIRGGNIGEGYINLNVDNVYVNEQLVDEIQLIKKNDMIVVASTGSKKVIGRVGICKKNYHDISFGAFLILVRPSDMINANYINYFFQSNFYRNRIRNLATGVNINNIRSEHITDMPIPLPPIDEQKKIVERIESLFSKLDAAKSIVQKILDGYELRRSAILHKAFTGELTKNFRAENNLTLDDWQEKTLGEVCKKFIYGTSKKSKSVGKIIVIRMGNLQNGEINWENLAYSDDEDDIKKYKLSAGDVLFNRTNSAELVGKTSIYRGEYPAIYAGYLIKLDYEKNILNGEYLNFILNSPEAKEYCDRVKSNAVNQSNINAKKIGAFTIPIPSLTEQKEIVRVLDSLLDKEQRTKEFAEKILHDIDLMKKSVLARAFRGEL